MFGSTVGSLGSRPHWPGWSGQRHGKAESGVRGKLMVAQASRNPQRQGYYNDATVTILK